MSERVSAEFCHYVLGIPWGQIVFHPTYDGKSLPLAVAMPDLWRKRQRDREATRAMGDE